MIKVNNLNVAGQTTQRSTEAGDFACTYDKAGHLTSATPPAALQTSLPVEAYTYDATGNRTSSTHQPGAWAYNPEHQLLQWSNAANQVSLRYNPNGHLQTQTVGGQTRTHSYDAADRLVEVKDNLGNSAEYSYDPQGRRIRKATPAKTTWYLYSQQGLIAELSDTGKFEKAYGWEPDQAWGTAPLWQATTSNGQINNAATADYHYLHTDHLGTVQMATDSNGNISWRGQAQAFGKVELDPTNRITMNLRLPGQYYDQETGTHYNWMRDYNGSTGRYIQRDPIGLEAGFNPYLYVDANPLVYIDPDGLVKGLQNPRDLLPLDGGGGGGMLGGGASRPANFSPSGSGRAGAFNEAKRNSGVPTSQSPTETKPNFDLRGNLQPGRQYEFDVPAPGGGTRRVTIRDDAGGHNFGAGNFQNRGSHFNDMCGRHYDY